MISRRLPLASAAVLAVGALALSGCTANDSGDDGGSTSMTLWHNSTTGPGVDFWKQTVADFEKENPGVTIDIQSIQNEDLDGKLQTALNSGDAPDIFLQRGGGKMAAMVKAGQLKDLTDVISGPAAEEIPDAAYSASSLNDKIYAMPIAVLPGGLFYSQDLFDQAGITENPTTMAELEAATSALRTAGVEPIALGAKDAWPAAHWYYWLALRECSPDTLAKAADEGDFSDDCWVRAGEDLQDFAATEPFNSGFLTTTAQQGAGSSAGLIANHQAAMELMGAWDPGVIGSLTPTRSRSPTWAGSPSPRSRAERDSPDR